MEDVLEPLEQFVKQFTFGTQEILKEGEGIMQQYQQALADVRSTRKSAFDLNEELERVEMQIEQ